jgi:tRNA pseudouridine55 synthase
MTSIPEGLLNVDKPSGITSHDVVQRVRRAAGLRRVGHAGTLDPLATGVLLLLLGRAARLAEYLVGQPKTYVTEVRLGQSTTTYDAEGAIVAERPLQVDAASIAQALEAFRGDIQQRAPIYSAIKKDGQPLYKLARRGEDVEPPLRTVTIYALDLLDWSPPYARLRVVCSAGTYIRSLAHDVGETLGCGGHVAALRRTAVGAFGVETAVALDALTPESWPEYLLPPETAVQHLPRLDLDDDAARQLHYGRRLPWQPGQPEQHLARAHAPEGAFLGTVALEGQTWQPRKLFTPYTL